LIYELGHPEREVTTYEGEKSGLPLKGISPFVSPSKAKDPFLVDDEHVIDESILPGPDGRYLEFRYDLVNSLQITDSLWCHRVRAWRGQTGSAEPN
jgi:hypothetical protein